MSYEGFEEYLCAKGHYWTEDALTIMYGMGEDHLICPVCKGKAVWNHSVDETNGYDKSHESTCCAKLTIQKQKKCPTCGKIEGVTYNIPKDQGRML